MQARVSLSLIVKNEEANLPACLQSVAGLVDEVVVIDTGSSDRTREIARAFGAKVFDFPWCDSFSAARNEGLRHATGQWVLWLDADEYFDQPNLEKVKSLVRGPLSVVRCPLSVVSGPPASGNGPRTTGHGLLTAFVMVQRSQ